MSSQSLKSIRSVSVAGRSSTVMASSSFISTLLLILLIAQTSLAEIRHTEIRSDSRATIPFDEFGFTHSGRLNLTVTNLSFSKTPPDFSLLGFYLCTRDSWARVLEQIQDGDIQCPLQSEHIKPVYKFTELQQPDNNDRAKTRSFDTSVKVSDPNLFTLLFSNCVPDLEVSMDVQSVMYNYNPKTGQLYYLSAGKASLPTIYFLFFLVYLVLGAVWIYTLYANRLTVYRIHFFMLTVVILKALNLICESEDKSYIERTGTAHGWDVVFYVFSFLKGITLFTLIVLIGTGWSFLKPYLQDKEKKVLMIVIPLQVVANVAQVVIDESGPFGEFYDTWKKVFLLVDIVCCCAVLFPIVWSIKNLREAAKTDGKAAVNLMKLTLFRQYYIIVISYIYFTRVVVYALETITSYKFQWTGPVAAELATLAFYVFTGYTFRPKVHNPYFAIDDEEEEAAAEALKLEDEFEL
ncbi:OLC1v1020877C1 [Oldenlandia corymbosa var. corymbosa]|uniref:OLC1v1020877C1 n=1 Tax=Oldenlandia corymbosa var. corymbosa TaxID=529605 RepID=A0AAV1BUG3_OLDCO|nr:OLC1v1020877C1 [Oldenlandia corymbosa var. corymbosa]